MLFIADIHGIQDKEVLLHYRDASKNLNHILTYSGIKIWIVFTFDYGLENGAVKILLNAIVMSGLELP